VGDYIFEGGEESKDGEKKGMDLRKRRLPKIAKVRRNLRHPRGMDRNRRQSKAFDATHERRLLPWTLPSLEGR